MILTLYFFWCIIYYIKYIVNNRKDDMMALLEYRDISKFYGSVPALKNVNLDIGSGRIVGLLGPNGSGKTTLIKLTAGILTPTAGTISVLGNPIGVESKKLISYLPERTYLNDTMTVADTIEYFKDFYDDFNVAKAYEMLQRLSIDLNMRIKAMSKGTREKVQLILVMSRDAKVYILDEPIAGVDPAARDYILDTIIKNYAEGSTVIISTHLITDVEKVIDDVLFLSYGSITLASTKEEIYREKGKTVDELFREVFRC